MNFFLSYGLKPWEPGHDEEALAISRALKRDQQAESRPEPQQPVYRTGYAVAEPTHTGYCEVQPVARTGYAVAVTRDEDEYYSD
ncbi:hypothetical protein HK101_011200, partial [Irineochytrium annulatum]